jgi:putative phage-type endonuclease
MGQAGEKEGREMIETQEAFESRRLGKVGASRIADIMSKGKGGEPSASRKNYMAELLCERLTGQRAESFTSAAIQWGLDHEDEARDAYELETGNIVTQCAGFSHPTIPMAGASPDGLIFNAEGNIILRLVEIKNPNTWTHLEFLDSGKIDMRYQWQMTWQMLCAKPSEWITDFVSFDCRLPDGLALKIAPYHIIDRMGVEAEMEVKDFLSELDSLESRMRARM